MRRTTWSWGAGIIGWVGVVGMGICFARTAWSREDVASLQSGKQTARDEAESSRNTAGAATPSDSELMYEAMKRSGQTSTKNDEAIDRAVARAKKDSERERKALKMMAARTWKDPFAEDPDKPIAVPGAVPRARRVARAADDNLRTARAETARARIDAASARAEAAVARAEAARAKADAARARADAAHAEAVAARAEAVAARDACSAVALTGDATPAGTPRRSRGARVVAGRLSAASSIGKGRGGDDAGGVRRAPTPAVLTTTTAGTPVSVPAAPPSPPSATSPLTGIIVVPITPMPARRSGP